MARIVTELYRIENVIYIRVKAVGERATACPTARLLRYQPKGGLPGRMQSDGVALESIDPH